MPMTLMYLQAYLYICVSNDDATDAANDAVAIDTTDIEEAANTGTNAGADVRD